jgi:hypothetical protein
LNSSARHHHAQAAARPHGKVFLHRPYDLAGRHINHELAREYRKRQRRLLHGERRPYAHTRADAKRKKRVALDFLPGAGQEPNGIEQIGIAPQQSVTMNHVWGYDDEGAAFDCAPADFRAPQRCACDRDNRRIEAQRLLDDGAGIGERVDRLVSGHVVQAARFREHALAPFGRLGQQIERPRQRA